MSDTEFCPSALGTKKHWDAVYSRELKSFQEYGDEGEIWFGEGSMTRVVRWITAQKIPHSSSVLDIGTGNGMLLVELAKAGYSNLTGVDYCADAIALARNICEKEEVSQSVKLQRDHPVGVSASALHPGHLHSLLPPSCTPLEPLRRSNLWELMVEKLSLVNTEAGQLAEVTDFLASFSPSEQFDICLDKGTFDAVSLDTSNAHEKRSQYVNVLCTILKPKGLFIITSCNWTKEELLKQFDKEFEMKDELPTPTFSFGGQSGHSVTALVFQRRDNS